MKTIVERTEYLRKLASYRDKDLIKVVTGIRRSGKSTLLELFRKRLIADGVSEVQTQIYNYELQFDFRFDHETVDKQT